MPSKILCNAALLVQFTNCRVLYRGEIIKDDFWVRDGKIMNPEKLFYVEKSKSDLKVDCNGLLIVPGYIDAQINGGFGYDFSSCDDTLPQAAGIASCNDRLTEALGVVAKGILKHGVTSFCPTFVTSPSNFYQHALPRVQKQHGGKHGAQILGAHVEGPYISREKKGAHNPEYIKSEVSNGISSIWDNYGSLDNIAIITVAPELPGMLEAIPKLVENNIVVSIGHSVANFDIAEEAVCKGASFITHLFNAMLPFHHRDPGIVGVLTSLLAQKRAFYGVISDGIHTHPTALRIAHRSHPEGVVIVTDAIAALGLPPGTYKLGSMDVVISDRDAKLVGTETLAGSINSMDDGVRRYMDATGCSLVDAVNAASLHPAQMLGITDKKGTLDYETDADFVFLDDTLNVQATFIGGEPVWVKEGSPMEFVNQLYA